MHVIVNKMLQVFVADTYGEEQWAAILRRGRMRNTDIETLLRQDTDFSDRLIAAVEVELDRPIGSVLEDVGTYLVSHPNAQSVRRLLRFCGVDFIDFLYSLEDLPDRIRLVVPNLSLPDLELREGADLHFEIRCHNARPGFVHLLSGIVRAMADDFGALALLTPPVCSGPFESFGVTLVEPAYTGGRAFALGNDETGKGAVP